MLISGITLPVATGGTSRGHSRAATTEFRQVPSLFIQQRRTQVGPKFWMNCYKNLSLTRASFKLLSYAICDFKDFISFQIAVASNGNDS